MLPDTMQTKMQTHKSEQSVASKYTQKNTMNVDSLLHSHDLVAYSLSPSNACLDEQRLVRQCVEALLFEKILPYEEIPRDKLTVNQDDIENIYSHILLFSLGNKMCVAIGAIKSFGRVRIAAGSIKYIEHKKYHELDLNTLISNLPNSEPQDNQPHKKLRSELEQTLFFCRWNRENLPYLFTERRHLSFNKLESRIHEGHLYHPCFKTRTGFSIQDNTRYGPEAENTFQLYWLAIKKPLLHQNLPQKANDFWKQELGDAHYASLTERLLQSNGSWDTFNLCPIHPWQFKAIFDEGLGQIIAQGDMINLGICGDYYHAGQSIRTLFNACHPHKANIKLPLNIISTSSDRNLKEHFVCSAPVVSNWLSDIVKNDRFLEDKNNLIMLKEYAGILYEKTQKQNENHTINEHLPSLAEKLGCIFRESVIHKISDDEAAVPFSSLMLTEHDGRPFIADWVENYGIELWLNQLIDIVVIPIWHLLVHHGVAFESHGQNLILVHKGGWPTKLVMRDFHEETEYMPDFLAPGNHPPKLEELDPYFKTIPDDEGHCVSTTDSLRDMFTDTICVFNLSELSFLLERCYEFKEERFWNIVRKKLNKYNKSGKTDPQRIKKINITNQELVVESLLIKKINNGGEMDFFFHRVNNDLA